MIENVISIDLTSMLRCNESLVIIGDSLNKENLIGFVSAVAVLGLIGVGIYDALYRNDYEIIKGVANIALIYLFGTSYGRVLANRTSEVK